MCEQLNSKYIYVNNFIAAYLVKHVRKRLERIRWNLHSSIRTNKSIRMRITKIYSGILLHENVLFVVNFVLSSERVGDGRSFLSLAVAHGSTIRKRTIYSFSSHPAILLFHNDFFGKNGKFGWQKLLGYTFCLCKLAFLPGQQSNMQAAHCHCFLQYFLQNFNKVW